MSSKSFYTNLVNPNLPYNAGNNGTVANPMTTTLDAGENSIINLPNPSTDGEPVTLAYFNSQLPSLDQSGNYVKNPMEDNLDAANNMIVNTTAVSMKDSVDTLLTYYIQLENGGVVTTNASDNTDSLLHIAINEGGTSKSYYTDFRSHPITNLGSLGFLDGGSISKNSSTFQFNQPLDINNNYLKDIQYLEFFNGGSLRMDPDDNLLYQDDIVVTSANINQYITEASGGWISTAESNLNMGTYSIDFGSGSVNLGTGAIFPRSQLGLTADISGGLTFGGQEVLVRQADVLESFGMTELSPGDSVNVNVSDGYPMASTPSTISSSDANLANPSFDIQIGFTTAQTMNLSTAYILIGLGDTNNPITATHTAEYLKISGACFTADSSGNYCARIITEDNNPNVEVLTAWADIWTSLTVNTAYVYASMFAETGSGGDVYVPNFSCTLNVVGSTANSDYYLHVDATTATQGFIPAKGQDFFIQTCQGVSNIPQNNGENTLYTVALPEVSGTMTLYISAKVVSTKYVAKIGCMYQRNAIVSGSETCSVLYSQGTVLQNISFVVEDGNLQVVSSINVGDIYNDACVKVKIVTLDS